MPTLCPIGYTRGSMPWYPNTLKALRERRGLTQAQLAELVGVTRVTVARLEVGMRQPGIDLLEALAKALRVKVTDLLSTVPGKTRKAPLKKE